MLLYRSQTPGYLKMEIVWVVAQRNVTEKKKRNEKKNI